MKKRAALLVALSLAVVTVLAGCGGKDSSKSADSKDSAATFEEKKEGDTFTVGFDQDFPPMGFVGDDGEYTGFDLELAKEVCDRNGWEFNPEPIAWDSKDALLKSGEIDCIWNGFTMNGREDEYTWSEPYLDNQQVFVVRADSGINSEKDLAGKTVDVQTDSSAEAALKDNTELSSTFSTEIIPDYNTGFMNLESGAREFVYNGGGFIGVGEPSGHQFQGHFLQLADLIGVEKETGFTLNYDKYNWEEHQDHFILADTTKPVDFGEGKKSMYAYAGTEILVQREKEVQMAVNEFGKGRSVYISGLPYSFENSRILYRSILWSAHGEAVLNQWFSTNFNVEVHAYVKNGKFCVVNNTYEPQKTTIYRGDGSSFELEMAPNEIKWYMI